MIGLEHFLAVGFGLFLAGLFCILTRRNVVGILMGVELLLNAANLNLVSFAHFGGRPLEGQAFALFVILLAASGAVITLAIVIGIYQNFRTIDVEATDTLRG